MQALYKPLKTSYHTVKFFSLILLALLGTLVQLQAQPSHCQPNLDSTSSQNKSWDFQWRAVSKANIQDLGFSTEQEKQMALCAGYYAPPTLFSPPELTQKDPEHIHGWANSYYYSKGFASLCGEVMIRKEALQIQSEYVLIDEEAQTADLMGQVTLTTQDSVLRGQSAKLLFSDNTTELSDAHFFLFPQKARGDAEKITTQSSQRTTIYSGRYTTCPPGNNDWFLEGEQIDLNHTQGWGTLKHMRLKIGEVPVFYLPYFKFPLNDERHTGFLFPAFNSISDPDLALPFYWNIAPNFDLLFSPRYIGGRGLMSESEFRYLHHPGEGSIELGYLPKDNQFDQQDRKSARWRHEGSIGPNWQWFSDVGYLSDNDYLNDLGAELNTIGQSFINRELTLQGNRGAWAGQLQLQSYQSIDGAIAPENQPYRKLPQLSLNQTSNLFDYLLEMDNTLEYTYWAQPRALSAPYAHRTHWVSRLSLPISDSWFFLTPSAAIQTSYYELMGSTSSVNKRTVPTMSLDAGLFFDRPLHLFSQAWTQSLEPRLFHTYTPLRTQDDIPIFDTTELTFGFDQLFRTNRFSGIDRIGDTHQTTLALTSKFLDTLRQERASFTVGQIFYHKNREIGLPGASTLTNDYSATVFRGRLDLSKTYSLSSGLSWNNQSNHIEDGNLSLIQPVSEDLTWRTQYRYRQASTTDERLEQINLAFRKHITGFWHLVSALHYDVENEQLLEQLTGFQYEDCCWRADLVYHRRIRSSTELADDPENNYSFLLQFELKGLGGIGSRLSKLLSNQIPGYSEEEY